ncbi:Protein kinase domain-containing protein [Caenorhabditis elegans]|uniref:Protein kinase domain-containing protein n=1 Tax=Caenorhabditis elegans TaxID=6239 RepID=O17955_CAEEL|nr:Protein kinase domain-containing protein [Caenorhabditis elegans]CAB05559.3 Protein kinase domain-containing protein [Caenorhabditis elegans]|eukprot:NP_506771.3 protein KINase [Caenorhabditis elegans]
MNPPFPNRFARFVRSVENHDESEKPNLIIVFLMCALFIYGVLSIIFVTICFLRRIYRSSATKNGNRRYLVQNTYVKAQLDTNSSSSLPVDKEIIETISINEETPIITDYQPLNERAEYLPYNPAFEIHSEHLDVFEKQFGQGNFGKVNKALLKLINQKTGEVVRMDVAVKKPADSTDKSQDKLILDEIKLMCAIGKHPNVLAIVGAITKQEKVIGREHNLVVTEFVEGGDLRSVLKYTPYTFHDELTSTDRTGGQMVNSDIFDELSTSDLYSFAYQIANGMEYLAAKPCVHRDLALRNVFVKRNKMIRIGDFGLARHHSKKSYYRMQCNPDTPLPIFWLAPECFNESKFTEMTDVWSYGVCLFELFSLGESPYKKLHNSPSYDVVHYLKKGYRLSAPRYCNAEIYEFMLYCWNIDATLRPKFTECKDFCKSLITRKKLKKIESRLQMEEQLQNELSLA